MLKVFDDLKSFQSLYLDNEDYLRALVPHLGSLGAMRLGVTDIRVSSFWEPQEILVYHNEGTVDIPDISI